ncbi:hypothetical protein VTI74DRAFT_6938 [Chaetomium olivicolor]
MMPKMWRAERRNVCAALDLAWASDATFSSNPWLSCGRLLRQAPCCSFITATTFRAGLVPSACRDRPLRHPGAGGANVACAEQGRRVSHAEKHRKRPRGIWEASKRLGNSIQIATQQPSWNRSWLRAQ